MSKILVVEDNKTLNDGLKHALESLGHVVVQNYGTSYPESKGIDLAIVDINIPIGSGYEVSKTLSCPILFLTARSDEKDMLKGFEHGCEDYVTKPFSLPILMEKVKVILRRHLKEDVYHYRNLEYKSNEKQLWIDKEEVVLTKKEHELITYFIKNKGQVLSKEQLLENIWDVHGEFVGDGTVNVTINRLRKKLNDEHQWIKTVFGIGYRWCEND